MSDLQEKLSQDVAEISWKDLQPHAKRDAIIVIQDKLDLPEVAAAIAQDNAASVQNWITNQLIAKPTVEQLTEWNSHLEKEFAALIVQPFVVIKEVSHS